MATAGLDADDIAYPARGIFRRQRNVDVVLGRVTGADLDRRTSCTWTASGPCLTTAWSWRPARSRRTYGVPGVEEHAFPLKHLQDAVALRNHVLRRFEEAAAHPDLRRGRADRRHRGRRPDRRGAVGRASPSCSRKVLAKDFKHLDVRRARVVLVEMTDRVLGTFTPAPVGPGAGHAARDGRRGAARRGRRARSSPRPSTSPTAGASRPTRWSGPPGVQAGAWVRSSGWRSGRAGGWWSVPTCPSRATPSVYAIGDVAATPDGQRRAAAAAGPRGHPGRPSRRPPDPRPAEGRRTKPFHYRDKGTMATIGRNERIAELPGRIRLSGFPGWLAWLGLHLVLLIGFRNRANVLLNWAWNYLTYDRGARLILD